VGYTSRTSYLFRVKASLVRVSRFASKLTEARRRVVHVAPSRRLCRVQAKDGQIGLHRTLLPTFAVFIILGPRGILVI
jgi:hypothetical protein